MSTPNAVAKNYELTPEQMDEYLAVREVMRQRLAWLAFDTEHLATDLALGGIVTQIIVKELFTP